MRRAFARAYAFGSKASSEEVKKKLAAANPGSIVQVAREGAVENEALVELLAAQTLRAESTGRLLAKKAEVDLLLRLAGTTQISKAIRELGEAKGKGFVAMNAGPKELAVPAEYGDKEVPRTHPTRSDFARVERAALLDAQRG